MAFFRRANEVIVLNVERFPQSFERLTHLIHMLLWRYTALLGGFEHLLAVLIRSCEEIGVASIHPMPAGDHIRSDGRVCMTQMWLVVHIVNRRGDVKTVRHASPQNTQMRVDSTRRQHRKQP